MIYLECPPFQLIRLPPFWAFVELDFRPMMSRVEYVVERRTWWRGVRGGVEYVVVVIKKKLRQCFCKLSTSGRAFFLVCLSSLFRFWLDVLNHIKHGKIGLLNTLNIGATV